MPFFRNERTGSAASKIVFSNGEGDRMNRRRRRARNGVFLSIICAMAVFLPSKTVSATTTNADYLDEQSVVLITGAAGFIGSELAMALHRTYKVKKILCVDSMEALAMSSSGAASPRNEKEVKEKPEKDNLYSHTEEEMALFEFKRQRVFHLLQTLGPTGHFYRADFRPSIPEFFDMGEVPLLDTIFQHHHDITHVVHLADPYHAASMDPNAQTLMQAVPRVKEQVKSGMMEGLLEQLKKAGVENGRIPHFVFASSYEVYNHLRPPKNNPNPPPFAEEKPLTTPSSLRGASKVIDEILATTYNNLYGIFSVGLRFFPVYGPWGLPGSPIFEMMERAVADPEIAIVTESAMLDDVRDFVYIDDAVDAIMTVMQYRPVAKKIPPVMFNVGTGRGSTLLNVAREIERLLPRSNEAVRVDNKFPKGSDTAHPTLSIASTERSEQVLGFNARVTLKEGLVRELAWHFDRAYPYGGKRDSDEHFTDGESGTSFVASRGIESCNPFDKECVRGAPVFPCASECSHERQCVPSFYDDVLYYSRALTKHCEAVLYTVALNDDLKTIPSATIAVSPESKTHLTEGSHCNLAFVSVSSTLVRDILREQGLSPLSNSIHDLIGKTSKAKLLTHGFWTLVPVATPYYRSEDDHVLRLLPKLSPTLFFASDAKYAIYCDPGVLFRNVPKLLEEAQMEPYKEGAEGRTALLIAKARENKEAKKMKNGSFVPGAQELQDRAYNMIRVVLRGEIPGGGLPIADSAWMVHTLQNDDSRLFRCDVFGEVLNWDVSTDIESLQFIMGLHDMWSRVITKWSGIDPWWVGDSVLTAGQSQVLTQRRLEEGDEGNESPDSKGENQEQQDEGGVQANSASGDRADVLEEGGKDGESSGEEQGDKDAEVEKEEEKEESGEETRKNDQQGDQIETEEKSREEGKKADPQEIKDVDTGDKESEDGTEKEEAFAGNVEEEIQKDREAVGDDATGEQEGENAGAFVGVNVDPKEAKSAEEEQGDRSGDGDDANESEEEEEEESSEESVYTYLDKNSDKWMGVLSASSTHYFVRIVSAEEASVVYLDEYQ